MKLNRDSFLTGFIPGMILPFIGALVFYFIFFDYMNLGKFVKHIVDNDKWISVLSLGTIANLLLFWKFLKMNCEKSARGVLGATFIYAFVVAYFKIF